MAMILKSVAGGSASVTRLDSIGFGSAPSCQIDALVGQCRRRIAENPFYRSGRGRGAGARCRRLAQETRREPRYVQDMLDVRFHG
jgi:hypothetical protein